MPAGDRTGRMGQGPMTGRGLGYCSGSDLPGFTKGDGYVTGRGFGFGKGMRFGRGIRCGIGLGHGWSIRTGNAGFAPRYPWAQPMNKVDEIKLLKSQADSLTRSQKDIEKRLGELEKE